MEWVAFSNPYHCDWERADDANFSFEKTTMLMRQRGQWKIIISPAEVYPRKF